MKPFREWLAEVQFYLMSSPGGVEHALFLHRTNTFCMMEPINGRAPAAIGMRDSGEMYMLLYYPRVAKLPLAAAAELLKHEIYHPIFGHCGTRGDDVHKIYGDKIFGVAVDLVVNQYINIKILEDAGMKGVTIEMFDLERDLTLEQYCHALQNPDPANPNKKLVDRTDCSNPASQDISAEQLIAAAHSAELNGDDTKDIEDACENVMGLLLNGKQTNVSSAESALVKIIEQIQQDVQQRKKQTSPGWQSGYCQENIEQVKRKPVTPWHMFLRKLEMHHMSLERVMSRKRPSRRHPAYYGRVKRMGLSAWFVVDTSGSMCDTQLSMVDSEVRSLAQRGCEVTFVHCDASVTKIEPYGAGLKVIQFVGRGGTDFSPVFDKLEELPPAKRPDFVVYFTDGFGTCYNHTAKVNAIPKYLNMLASNRRPPMSPRGIDTLWLIPADGLPITEFYEAVPFGHVSIVPLVENSP